MIKKTNPICKMICTFISFCDSHEDNRLPRWLLKRKVWTTLVFLYLSYVLCATAPNTVSRTLEVFPPLFHAFNSFLAPNINL